MSEDFKNKVGRILCQAWNEGMFDNFNDVYSENFVRHRQPLVDINGLDNFKEYISKFRNTFPGVECSYDEIIVTENAFVTKLTFQVPNSVSGSSHSPSMMRYTKTERYLVAHMKNKKVLEAWQYYL